MAEVTRAVIYPAEIDRILKMPGGPVGVSVRRLSLNIAKNAEQLAKNELGKHPMDAKRTGNYARRFGVRVERTGGGFEFHVYNNAKYAAVLELGSRPHEIRARRAKYLRFRGRDGRWRNVKIVRHPGQERGYFILRRATEKAVRETLRR